MVRGPAELRVRLGDGRRAPERRAMLRAMGFEAYGDRLQARTHTDDEVVGVFPAAHSEVDAVWLSAPLRQLTSTASRYGLHVLPWAGRSPFGS
jgi:hypothetical protein